MATAGNARSTHVPRQHAQEFVADQRRSDTYLLARADVLRMSRHRAGNHEVRQEVGVGHDHSTQQFFACWMSSGVAQTPRRAISSRSERISAIRRASDSSAPVNAFVIMSAATSAAEI